MSETSLINNGAFSVGATAGAKKHDSSIELEQDRRRYSDIHASMDAFQMSTNPTGYRSEGGDDSDTVLSDMAGFPRNEPDMDPSLYPEQGINGDTPVISLQGAIDAQAIQRSEIWKQVFQEATEYVTNAENKARDLKAENRIGWLDRAEGAKAVLGLFAQKFEESAERLAKRTTDEKMRSNTSIVRPAPRREIPQPNPTPDMLTEFLEPTLAPALDEDRKRIAEHTARAVSVLEQGKKLTQKK